MHLLDEALIRVGNEEYARENDSYGLTTLRNNHVDVSGSTVHFTFRGKSGKTQEIDVRDRRVAQHLRMQDLPGEHLFQYVDEDGTARAIGSEDVTYLQEIAGEAFTAKDFRTWGARSWPRAPCAVLDLREPDGDEGEHRRRHRRSSRAPRQHASVCRAHIHPPSSSAMRAASFASIATTRATFSSMRTALAPGAGRRRDGQTARRPDGQSASG